MRTPVALPPALSGAAPCNSAAASHKRPLLTKNGSSEIRRTCASRQKACRPASRGMICYGRLARPKPASPRSSSGSRRRGLAIAEVDALGDLQTLPVTLPDRGASATAGTHHSILNDKARDRSPATFVARQICNLTLCGFSTFLFATKFMNYPIDYLELLFPL